MFQFLFVWDLNMTNINRNIGLLLPLCASVDEVRKSHVGCVRAVICSVNCAVASISDSPLNPFFLLIAFAVLQIAAIALMSIQCIGFMPILVIIGSWLP